MEYSFPLHFYDDSFHFFRLCVLFFFQLRVLYLLLFFNHPCLPNTFTLNYTLFSFPNVTCFAFFLKRQSYMPVLTKRDMVGKEGKRRFVDLMWSGWDGVLEGARVGEADGWA